MPVLAAAILLGFAQGCPAQVSPAARFERYAEMMRKPLRKRVIPADKAVIERAHRTNLVYGQDVRPRAAGMDHPLVPDVMRAISQLPAPVRALTERYLVAIFLAENDFGTATSEGVRHEMLGWRYAYILLNLTELRRTANQWASWKENTAFRPSPGHDLRVVLEEDARNDRTGAIRFILLHELGHVVGQGARAHGFLDSKRLPPATRNSPFVKLSWRFSREGKMVSRWQDRYPRIHQALFYQPEKTPLSLDMAEAVYGALELTNFPSHYGAINLLDDFAESFAIYVHTRLLKKPYRVELSREGEQRLVYRSCIQTGTCPQKTAWLKRLLRPGSG